MEALGEHSKGLAVSNIPLHFKPFAPYPPSSSRLGHRHHASMGSSHLATMRTEVPPLDS